MKIELRNSLFILQLLLAFVASGQSAEQWIGWGDAAMERQEYYGASKFYEGALELEPGRMNLQWKQAEASRLSNQYDKAAEHYARVYQKDQGRTYPEALRWLAEMQMSQGLYDEAEKSWNKLIQRDRNKSSFNAQRAANGLKGCALAKSAMQDTTTIDVEHLPQPVNTYDSEFGARIGPDQNLYLSSLRGEFNKDEEVKDTADYRTRIYHATPADGTWTEPVPVPSSINAEGDNANISWSPDGSRKYFTRCFKDAPCRILVSVNESDPQPLRGLGNDMSTQPMIAMWDGREMLLFVSDRPGGEGGTDIWQAEMLGDSAASVEPLNGKVNTIGNERTPWFDATTNTLYFSSDLLPGMGGYDIFTSTWSNDEFGEPINAGIPLNSPANDLYPYISSDRGHIWIASNRLGSLAKKGKTCCSDIYRLPLDGSIVIDEEIVAAQADTSSSTGTVAPATPATTPADLAAIEQRFPVVLYFHNDDPDPRTLKKRTDQTYEQTYQRYRSLLPEYVKQKADPARLEQFFEEHVVAGRALLNDLIDALIPALAKGDDITLVVRGHASPLAKGDYNQNLSLRRISSLRNHLREVQNGALLPYMNGTAENGGRLNIEELPFGEDKAETGVSDDLSDLERSVYSVAAMKERRIEIEALEIVPARTNADLVELKEAMGDLHQDQERIITFSLRNDGHEPLRLIGSKADCGCTTAQLPDQPIPPGETMDVEVLFNGRAPLGVISRSVTILTDGNPKQFRLTMEGVMVR